MVRGVPRTKAGSHHRDRTLTSMEMGAAYDARKTKLFTRFKNSLGGSRSGRKAKANTTSVIDAMVRSITECEKPTHMLQEQEAYSKLFYTTRVQPTVKGSLEKAAQEHRTLTNGERVALVKKETAMLYAQESPDIKDQVKQYLEDQKQQRIQDKQIGRRQTNLDKLAAVANSFLKGLAEATGMSFSLLAGGPSPEALGAIDIYSFHVGQTKLGNNFSTAYPGFDAGVMEPFRDFLHRVYPEAGVSSPQQQEGSSATGGDTYLDIYNSGNELLSFWDTSSGTSGSGPSMQQDTSLDGLLTQSPILPTAPLPPSHGTCDDWTTPDLDIFLSNLDVQMGLEPLAGASEIATLTMVRLPPASPFTAGTVTLPPDTSSSMLPAISLPPDPDTSSSILPAVSHTPQLDTTSTPPPDTSLNILPAISHIPQPVTTSGHPPDTSLSAESLTSELPLTSTTPSFDVDPLTPTPGSDHLDEIETNDGTALETRRTKRIPKPSTRNDAANVIGASRKENKCPRAEMSSYHGSK
ncbi:hypothetical protein DEU56DRAFT_951235 [Suillus clintonianus]|uniref:uncharacterized protein n=1 Tax=Suillus clintonianus TaxID=1904413 RepID=UPI001B880949|nr:uncharacterized protein DEU56DRAFT_951235 [Suillus clintonianus]KAG2153844.1 hypothetical protein DEU56DRAFT_951235 [Suillus clintonianus]